MTERVIHQKAKGPVDPRVGQRIHELRIQAGLTQAQLAGHDFSKGFISLLETGRTRISLRAAHVFAARLGLHASDIVAAGDGVLTAPLDVLTAALHALDEIESFIEEKRPIIARALALIARAELANEEARAFVAAIAGKNGRRG